MKKGKKNVTGRCLFEITAGLSLFLIIFATSCLAAQKEALKIIDNNDHKIMIASGHPNYPPFMWKSGETIKGAGVDLIQLICKELDIPLEIKWSGPWQRVQNYAKAGSLDFIVGIYSNEERRAFLDYTISYIPDPTSITVLKDNVFEFKDRKDLIGKTGITMYGDSFGQEFDNYIDVELNLKRAYTAEAIVKNLMTGRIEYVIWGYYPTIINATEQGVYDKVRILEPPVVIENMYMAFSKKSPFKKYLPAVNSIIERYKKDGTVVMIVERNLSIYNTKTKE